MEEVKARIDALGFRLTAGDALEYKEDYEKPVSLSCGLIMVPHGKTPSNRDHLFQDHSDSDLSKLLPEGVEAAKRGAAKFMESFGGMVRDNPDQWVMYRSPLSRTGATAEPYMSALREDGALLVEPIVDPELIEINQGSWAGLSVKALAEAGRTEDAEAAQAYREKSFLAKALDGSGESKFDVLHRAAAWLRSLEERHGSRGCNVLVFGHGTFQNCVELLLRCYPEKSAEEIFTRNPSGGSHLRRGEAHVLAPLQEPAEKKQEPAEKKARL
eukprot:TRINITY_DN36089_c0_g1_i1.p1 TRINITY_DN36089_c0_g1~~TRINITY_DN36089_c0_g1_i1.p1  ORF type:complete len:280 (+),score=52.32 TRINITY_DN36089_c0_g1_i1:28-840(+)